MAQKLVLTPKPIQADHEFLDTLPKKEECTDAEETI